MNRSLRPAALGLATLLGAFVATASHASGPDWRGWNDGLQQAGATRRPVIVDVYTNWCGWCRRMHKDVYDKPEIAEYLRKHFVTVRLNAEASDPASYEGKQTNSQGIAQRFRVSGFPTTVFLRSNGDHMANVPGYVAADRFMLLLRYVAEGYADRNVPFTEFEKSLKTERVRR
ncbi:MAG: thioredoxin fold domain-containing protein [Candidatus Eisenbacteria bacterium]